MARLAGVSSTPTVGARRPSAPSASSKSDVGADVGLIALTWSPSPSVSATVYCERSAADGSRWFGVLIAHCPGATTVLRDIDLAGQQIEHDRGTPTLPVEDRIGRIGRHACRSI